MAERDLYVGSVGPLIVDDADTYDDGKPFGGIRAHQLIVDDAPTDDKHVIRMEDMSLNWPIGAVFISVVATNPATLLGFGTWQAIASGKFLVGLDSSDTDFDTSEETGGAKTHLHSVDVLNTTSSGPSATSTVSSGADSTVSSDTHTHDVNPTSVNTSTVSNIPPYFVVYMWKRTA